MTGVNMGVVIGALGFLFTFLTALIAWLVKLGRWQGRLEGKLDRIVDLGEEVEELQAIVHDHESRLTTLEVSCNLRHGH